MSCTRPDIAFAVSRLSQYPEKPQNNHWEAVKRVLTHLSGTQRLGIQYGGVRNGSRKIIGYSHSDYDGDTSERKSTSGYIFVLACG